MYRVKIFRSVWYDALEDEVNKWIEDQYDEPFVLEIDKMTQSSSRDVDAERDEVTITILYRKVKIDTQTP